MWTVAVSGIQDFYVLLDVVLHFTMLRNEHELFRQNKVLGNMHRDAEPLGKAAWINWLWWHSGHYVRRKLPLLGGGISTICGLCWGQQSPAGRPLNDRLLGWAPQLGPIFVHPVSQISSSVSSYHHPLSTHPELSFVWHHMTIFAGTPTSASTLQL